MHNGSLERHSPSESVLGIYYGLLVNKEQAVKSEGHYTYKGPGTVSAP